MWVWVTALPERLLSIPHLLPKRQTQISRDFLRFALQLAPGDAHRPPAFGEEDPVPLLVALEVPLRPVDAAAVELDRNPLGLPERVNLKDAPAKCQGAVHPRPSQAVHIDKGNERLLEVVPREPHRLPRLQQRPQVPRTPTAGIPLKQNRQRNPVPQPPHFRL